MAHQMAVALAWRNLQYEVGALPGVGLGAKKTILQRLAGSFASGTLNGLMGPSGAGKTTLLNALSGQKTSSLTGDTEIYLGAGDGDSTTKVVSYFIGQHVQETMLPSLTVRQILEYAYTFKNGSSGKISALREEHLTTVMHQLMLPGELLERPFGRCSGGEQKRLAIAQELMALEKPTFLFIDEPTTGLDSTAALQVMACLKGLSQSVQYQVTVVVSIHVPNHDILALFDKLYVMAKGGHAIYSGPPDQIQAHLETIIGAATTEEEQPIEELIKIACDGESSAVLALSCDCQTTESQAIAFQQNKLTRQPFGLPNTRQTFGFGHLSLQTSRLLTLTFLAEWRHFGKQLLNYILVLCIIIFMFSGEMIQPNGCTAREEASNGSSSSGGSCLAVLDTTSLLQENVNFLYISLQTFVYITLASACVMFSPMVKIFRNEHRNRWYSLGSFYLSFTLVSLLQLAIYTLTVAFLLYFASGQYINDGPSLNWTRLGHYVFCLFLFSAFTQSIGQLLGVIFLNSPLGGLIITIITYMILLMVDDFFIKSADILYAPFVLVTETVGLKNLIRYLLFIFYGIDRCNPETETSFLLASYGADGDDVAEVFTRTLLRNTVILRLATFLLMYFKFSSPLDALWRFFAVQAPELRSTVSPHSAHVNLGAILDDLQKEETPKKKKVMFKQVKATLPVFPEAGKVMFAWRSLSLFGSSSIYELNSETDNRSKVILRSVAGQVTFGSLSALMGPSGAGKTSLLRVLNGQFKDRLSAGTSFYLSKWARIKSCFITQEVSDHLWPGLTAKQALIYASRLKNASVSSHKVDHESIATRLLEELGLSRTAETRLERCSGGERKRLALAQELTSLEMPNLICIDEPTSGLDSASADIVMGCLKALVTAHPIAIVTSIHQPNSSILARFDQIYVLARGGLCIYSGPPGDIHAHLRQLAPTTPDDESAKFCNETLISHACLGHEAKTVKKLARLNNRQFDSSRNAFLTDVLLAPDGIQQSPTRFSLSSFTTLWRRNLAYSYASQLAGWLSFIVFSLFFVNIIIFIVHNHRHASHLLSPFCINIVEDDTSTGSACSAASRLRAEQISILQAANTFHFFLHMFIIGLFNIQGASTFFYEFPRLRAEHRNGWYSMGAFYLMKSLFEMAVALPILALYLYFGDLYSSLRPGMYWYIFGLMILAQLAWQGMSHLLIVLVSDSLLLQYMLQLSLILVAGFLANFLLALSHLHYVYQFIANFSILRWLFEALMLLIYGLGRCDPRREIQPTLYWMGIEDSHLWTCLIMLGALFCVYRVGTLWALSRQLNSVENRRQRVEKVQAYLVNLKSPNAIVAGLSSPVNHFTKLSV